MTEQLQCPFDLARINSEPHAHRAYAAARADHGPVFRADDLGAYVAVLGYDQVRAAAGQHDELCSGQGATIPGLGVGQAIPTEVDLPEHRRYRKLLQPELRPDRVSVQEARMVEIVDGIIDGFIEQGRGDLREIAEQLPALIIAEILGAPNRGQEMLEVSDLLNRAAGRTDDAAKQAKQRYAAFIEELVTDAENDPESQGLLGLISRADLTHAERVRMGISLVIAGHETTVNGISSLLWLLGEHPQTKQRVIDDPGLLPKAVDEALRLESPVTMMGRTATEPVTLAGVEVEVGEKVGLFFGAANLDPARFPDPGTFDIDRSAQSHLAFGHGIHRCVGEHLAKLEMRVAAEVVLRRIPDYRIDGDVRVGANIAMNRGLTSVPVVFTANQLGGTSHGE